MHWFILSGIVGGVAVIVLLIRGRSTARRTDVGAVSDQWIAQHRADRPYE
jgi:hypothetical protein